jgi:hypothetical protein
METMAPYAISPGLRRPFQNLVPGLPALSPCASWCPGACGWFGPLCGRRPLAGCTGRILDRHQCPQATLGHSRAVLFSGVEHRCLPGDVDGSTIGLWLSPTPRYGCTRTSCCRRGPASGPSPVGCATPCPTLVISAHGHVDSRLVFDDGPFPAPSTLFVTPGHCVTRLCTPIVAH